MASQQQRCRLLDLPPEIRNKIYAHVFDNGRAFVNPRFMREPSLLLTCKRIRAEARLMWYAQNSFLILTPPGQTLERELMLGVLPWLVRIGPEACAAIPRLRIVDFGWVLPANLNQGDGTLVLQILGRHPCFERMDLSRIEGAGSPLQVTPAAISNWMQRHLSEGRNCRWGWWWWKNAVQLARFARANSRWSAWMMGEAIRAQVRKWIRIRV